MELLNRFAHYLGPVVQGAVVIVGVVVAMAIVRRMLSRNLEKSGSNRFRNQLIILGSSFVGLLIIVLGLPFDSDTRGQLLGLIGLLFSAAIALSSSTILGNAMAGIMLKAVRNFRSGDFIRVDGHCGRVTERGLFHTEIQTPDRDLTTLPNMFLATSAVTVLRSSGTIIDAKVSLGYDINHGFIEEELLKAAHRLDLKDAFVQVLELGDYAVTYRLAGLLVETKQILAHKSRLRKNVLDVLHEAGIEIVSPEFRSTRIFDKTDAFIPERKGRGPTRVRDSAPVEVVFDKAEDAESLVALQTELGNLENRLTDMKKAVKEAVDDAEKERLTSELETVQAQYQTLHDAVKEAESREDTE